MRNPLPVLCRGALVFLALALGAARGEVRLPAIFSDHMVLQAGVRAPIWGWARPGERIRATFLGRTASGVAGPDGRWQVELEPCPAGARGLIEVAGDNVLTVADVLVGEVWIGSGQSNMGFPFKMDFYPYLQVKDYAAEKAAAQEPEIRMFLVTGPAAAETPQDDCRGRWYVTTPENVDRFSAELYFFGRELHRELKVPVGLIKSAVGGTEIRLWIDPAAQRAAPELRRSLAAVDEERRLKESQLPADREAYRRALAAWELQEKAAAAKGEHPPRRPGDPDALFRRRYTLGGLFNGMIAPLAPYAIRGVVWHQGENDAGRPDQAAVYKYELPLLIKTWRARWGRELPFAWVQLANLDNRTGDWPAVREAMRRTLSLPGTGMVVAIDAGESHNIHPIDKQTIGHRLALWALGDVYGRDVETSGPLLDSARPHGGTMEVTFTHVRGGLVARGGALQGFEIAGTDGRWHEASARIVGDTVVVQSPAVAAPAAVRYAWTSDPACNLYNGAGLPASPFTTAD